MFGGDGVGVDGVAAAEGFRRASAVPYLWAFADAHLPAALNE